MRFLRRALLILAFCLGQQAAAESARRVLLVSFYPYIPGPEAAALALKQGFEALHPDVLVRMEFNPHYYSLAPSDHGVLYEDADIHTIDVVFLADFLARHKLAPLTPALLARLPAPEPLALQASSAGGVQVAVPFWMCSDFLIYRKDLHGLDHVRTLAGLQQGLGGTGLIFDMAGPDALGELYFGAVLAGAPAGGLTLAHIPARPDPAILARLRQMLALEPPGFGREPAYSDRYGFYARQFARRAAGAFIGYSEMTHEVLDETNSSCRLQDRCVAASGIGVAAVPFHDGAPRPAVWVDMFGIDARVHGQRLRDAEDFIAYAVSLPSYRALLVPAPGEAPRYLLPATREAFRDPAILAAAPLYPRFQAILEQGAVVTLPHLGERLHDAAHFIDRALPVGH